MRFISAFVGQKLDFAKNHIWSKLKKKHVKLRTFFLKNILTNPIRDMGKLTQGFRF
jgi:hypothetical protein